jgi:hypothetical protein
MTLFGTMALIQVFRISSIPSWLATADAETESTIFYGNSVFRTP